MSEFDGCLVNILLNPSTNVALTFRGGKLQQVLYPNDNTGSMIDIEKFHFK